MMRGENIVCGTSSTGTGTLTLAACPAPPGGVDFYAWLTSSGLGFVNGNAVFVSYVINEYTDSTFGTIIRSEEGVGTLTLGANLAASTLARTTVQATQTAQSTTGVYLGNAPSAISVGTAANTLIFIGPKATDVMAHSPYFEAGIGDNLGCSPAGLVAVSSVAGGFKPNTLGSTITDFYVLFQWAVPMLVKRCSVNVGVAGSGGNSNANARLYQKNSSGRPGKLLYDFGLFGSANASFHSTGNVSTGAAGAGFMLLPGEYFLDVCYVETDSTHAALKSPAVISNANALTYPNSGGWGTSSMLPYGMTSATGGAIGAAPDPANVAAYAGLVLAAGTGPPLFTLAPS